MTTSLQKTVCAAALCFEGLCMLAIVSCTKTSVVAEVVNSEDASAASSVVTYYKDNEKVPVDITVFIECANGGKGEYVTLTGMLHVTDKMTVNKNHVQVKSHVQPQGIRGYGEITGDKYQGTGVSSFVYNGSFKNGQLSYTEINNFRIIGQGKGNNYLVHSLMHFTINANGTSTAYVDKVSVECK